jgi:hypothetical protein
MTLALNLLPGLPPYGPTAVPFPAEWGRTGREGTVVEFTSGEESWVANFQPGIAGLQLAELHPNGRDAVVVAAGDLWVVDVANRSAQEVLPAIDSALPVDSPPGWIFTRQGLALARFGPAGILWHTKRLSLDGFDQVRIDGDRISGVAWIGIEDQWVPFEVELGSGRSWGGGFSDDDIERWERIARGVGSGAG